MRLVNGQIIRENFGSRSGANSFKDQSGHLWLFGGANSSQFGYFADLWMYTIDSTCTRCGVFADTTIVDTSTTGLSQNFKSTTVSIYPNPASSTFFIRSLNEKITKIEVVNMLGEKVIELVPMSRQAEIDMKDNPRGIYYVEIRLLSGIVVKRLSLE